MKKFICAIAATFVMGMAFTSCSMCSHKTEPQPTEDGTKVTKLINADKAHMDSIDNTYMYFETTYTFAGTVDTLTTPDVAAVSNVFEIVDTVKMEPTVYLVDHVLGEKDSAVWDVKIGSFWLEDFDLRHYTYRLTVEDAFNLMKLANVVKPKSKYCVLRAQLGPKACNPQFIFGNDKTGMVFVDAITGAVAIENPVFGKAQRLTTLK